MSQPIPVIPLDYERPVPSPRTPLLAGLVAVAWVACAVAWSLIAFVDVESVLVTGPVVAVLGVCLALTGASARRPTAVWLGVAHIAVCALFFLLAWGLGWGPRQATRPFAVMGGLYCVVTALPTFLLLFLPDRRR